jgi:iron complex transport system ATP-binding protein
MAEERIKAEGLRFAYGRRLVLDGVDFAAGPAEAIALIGPNGAGKSTLFRCLLGLLSGYDGVIRVDGRDLRSLRRREMARRIAYVPQSAAPVFNHTVLETILMGFAGRIGVFGRPDPEKRKAALAAAETLGIASLQNRGFARLSGGERQLVLLARALVQDARILVMDEPAANLDYGNRHRALARVRALAQSGYTVILSTHDPSDALLYATRAVVLDKGRVTADDVPAKALTPALLSRLYGMEVTLGELECEGRRVTVCAPAAPP